MTGESLASAYMESELPEEIQQEFAEVESIEVIEETETEAAVEVTVPKDLLEGNEPSETKLVKIDDEWLIEHQPALL